MIYIGGLSEKKQQPTISLSMLVKNEGLLLGQCLQTVKSSVDEIIIIDTGSKDRTIKIAKKFGARVIQYKWDGRIGRAMNECMKNASGQWILVLDADERIAEKDLFKLKRLVKDTKTLGYIFPVHDYSKRYDLLRNWHPNDGKYPEEERFSSCPGWGLIKKIRLFQRRAGFRYREGPSLHAYLSPYLRKYKREIKECDIVIHHFQYLKGEEFVAKKQKNYLKNELKEIKIFSDNPWSYFNIGIALFRLEKDEKAIRYLKKAVKFEPKFEMAYFVLGMAYKEKARYKEAAASLKRSIRINPRYADAWTVLGIVYDLQNRLQDAETALKKAIRIHPAHPLAHNSLGIVFQNQGKLKDAEEEYKKAIKIHPQHPDAYYNLGLLYEEQQRFKDAKKIYRFALKINPKDRSAKSNLDFILKK